jgi:hypothetical protein
MWHVGRLLYINMSVLRKDYNERQLFQQSVVRTR